MAVSSKTQNIVHALILIAVALASGNLVLSKTRCLLMLGRKEDAARFLLAAADNAPTPIVARDLRSLKHRILPDGR